MRQIFTLVFLLAPFLLSAQITYKQGYFISESGEKVEAIIQDLDWTDHPKSFKYKLSVDAELKDRTIENTPEFSYDNKVFVRYNIKTSPMANTLIEFSDRSLPNFIEETAYLRILTDGSERLLSYRGRGSHVFYVQSDDKTPEPLIFTKYYENSKLGINEAYKQQLKSILKCFGIETLIEESNYLQSDLTEIFLQYYNCQKSAGKEVKSVKRSRAFHPIVAAGVQINMLEVEYQRETEELDSQFSAFATAGVEYNFPFWRNKLSVIALARTYSIKYNEPIDFNVASTVIVREDEIKVDYSAVNLAFGVRFYSYPNENLRLFLEPTYSLAISEKGGVTSEFGIDRPEISSKNAIIIGLGIAYKNIEFAVQPIVSQEFSGSIKNTYSTVRLGYRF